MDDNRLTKVIVAISQGRISLPCKYFSLGTNRKMSTRMISMKTIAMALPWIFFKEALSSLESDMESLSMSLFYVHGNTWITNHPRKWVRPKAKCEAIECILPVFNNSAMILYATYCHIIVLVGLWLDNSDCKLI